MSSLSNLNALVTGGSSGIGRTIAIALAQDGYSVTVVARSASKLIEVRDTLPIVRQGQVHYIWELDMEDIEAATSFKGAPLPADSYDVIASNSGVTQFGPVSDVYHTTWQQVLTVNLTAPIALAKAYVKAITENLRNKPAHIIFTSAVLSRGYPYGGVYSASKGGIDAFASALAHEVGPQGIHVNTVNPGMTKTDIAADIDVDSFDLPISGWIQPEAIAEAVLFLARSTDISGMSIPVDNGWSP